MKRTQEPACGANVDVMFLIFFQVKEPVYVCVCVCVCVCWSLQLPQIT